MMIMCRAPTLRLVREVREVRQVVLNSFEAGCRVTYVLHAGGSRGCCDGPLQCGWMPGTGKCLLVLPSSGLHRPRAHASVSSDSTVRWSRSRCSNCASIAGKLSPFKLSPARLLPACERVAHRHSLVEGPEHAVSMCPLDLSSRCYLCDGLLDPVEYPPLFRAFSSMHKAVHGTLPVGPDSDHLAQVPQVTGVQDTSAAAAVV
jgi:hypothetical protein